ncbi:ATP-binding protein [Flavobacterium psychrotrophum]|uniref:ATP-binding protein n=1 Tax=Flavobacterium psychrotrophum TaxID=2294119 RepID=UPI000E31F69B|nr:ATP-binding protein [Flavobacterium psychrotrophum]
MKIKTKLILSFSILFLLIVVLSGLAIRQVNYLARDTRNILTANYQSLDYSRAMYKLMDDIDTQPDAIQLFQDKMRGQGNNITEVGEKELTQNLQQDFKVLIDNRKDTLAIKKVRADLNSIMKLNMDAIKRKSSVAEKTADRSEIWIGLSAAVCFILGFTMLLNLPDAIAGPVKKLTESIRQIAVKNYSHRVYLKGNDEFATLAKTFNSMAQKLEEYTASDLSNLMTEKKRVELLISTMEDPVIGLDENHNVLFANDGALAITGLKKEALLNKNIQEVALFNDLVHTLSKDLIIDRDYTAETLKIYADKKESYFEKVLVPINITPTGETELKRLGTFIILRNITAFKELDFAKTNFIATVSHEFKTPIASMKMGLQLLSNERTGVLNTEQQSLVEGIREDADRLLRTTGELLQISEVETGNARINAQACDVEEIINEAIDSNKIAALSNNISIDFKISDGFPDIVADKEKTVWVLSNLISNAIRYSYENSVIEIHVSTKKNGVEIRVKDSGAGIPEAYLSRIFDKYFRVPGTQKEGTGLGLAISKEFMEAQGGNINVMSTLGEGSVFTLSFISA